MKVQETTSNKKNYNFTSIRVKDGTKEVVNKFLTKVNKTEDCGKVTSDLLINFFLRIFHTSPRGSIHSHRR